MALHTFSLGSLVKTALRQYGKPNVPENWPYAYGFLGMGGYTLTDSSRIPVLNNKIIKHFYFHEIGCDTPGQFAFYMDEALNLIMPYYDQLYQCEYLKAANLVGVSYEELVKELYGETGKRDTTGTTGGTATTASEDSTYVDGQIDTDGTVSGTNSSTGRFLDTPQTQIQLLDDGFLTSAQKNEGTTSETTDNTQTGHTTTTAHGNTETTSSGTNEENQTTSKDGNRTEERSYFMSDPKNVQVLYNLGRALLNIDEQVVTSKEIHECFWWEYDY